MNSSVAGESALAFLEAAFSLREITIFCELLDFHDL